MITLPDGQNVFTPILAVGAVGEYNTGEEPPINFSVYLGQGVTLWVGGDDEEEVAEMHRKVLELAAAQEVRAP